MKKIILIITITLAMITPPLTAWTTHMCLYNGSGAAIRSASYTVRQIYGSKYDQKISDSMAVGDKVCTGLDTSFPSSISWEQNGQHFSSGLSNQAADLYIDKNNTVQVWR